jgi:hypothetical protein
MVMFMANKADEFIKKLEAGDVLYYEMPAGERKKTLELLTSPENKKKALDSLVAAATSKPITAREAAADLLDAIGDKGAIKKVAEFWMPFLDMEYGGKMTGVPAFDKHEKFNRRPAVEIFERMRWPPAADHEALLIKNGGLKDLDFIQVGAIFNVMEKCGSEKHEDVVLKATKEAIAANDDVNLSFDALGAIGTGKSKAVLNEFIDRNKNNRDPYVRGYVEDARKAVKEIEKRMTVSSKPAEKTLEDAMKRKKVPA